MSRWMGIIAVNRPMNLAEASTGQQRRKHMQANKQMNPHKASFLLHPPLHLGCSASRVIFFFFLPQFLCLFFSPICCVWTWPLGANSLPWTPSAVWLSTVNWARLVVSGRDRGCVVTCSACRLLPPGIIFHRRLPGSRERECDEKRLFVKALALLTSRSTRAESFFNFVRLFYTSPLGKMWKCPCMDCFHNMIQKQTQIRHN